MIKSSGYTGMDWVDALRASKPSMTTEQRIASVPEDQAIDSALERTVEAVFDIPTSEKTGKEALQEASRDIHDKIARERENSVVGDIKAKLASREVDPVALGVVTKEQWDGMTDPRMAYKVATRAAIAHEKKLSGEWQANAMKAPSRSQDERRDNRILSMPAMGDDSMRPMVPLNANSIMDPNRLDRLAEKPTAHDESVKAIREARAARDKELAGQESNTRNPIIMNDGSKILRSGSQETSEFMQKAPRNQISIMDVAGTSDMTMEERKAKIEALFLSKLEDNGVKIKEAGEKHRQSIQRESAQKKDRSWEKVSKQTSTSDMSRRLADLWIPKE